MQDNRSAQGSVLTDEQIVAEIRNGATALYEILMRRHNERLYRAVRAILRDDAETEEVMQEAYVRAYAHLDQFEGKSQFLTWLTRIAVHEAFGRLRFNRRFATQPESPAGEEFMEQIPSKKNPEGEYMQSRMAELLEDWIGRLPEKYRLVFVLREVEELSTRDTAECLAIDEEAVKSRLFRARAMLRKRFEARGITAYRQAFHFGGERCNRVVSAVMSRISPPSPAN